MSKLVKIIKGWHRGQEINNRIFELARPWKDSAGGGFITVVHPVDTEGLNGFRNYVPRPRIQCNQEDFVYVDSEGNDLVMPTTPLVPALTTPSSGTTAFESNLSTRAIEAFKANETDDEVKARIRHTFGMLEKATDSVSRGVMRGLIVSGPPGIGKSFGVEKKLKEASLMYKIKTNDVNYQIVSGTASAIGLYQILYQFKDEANVICFDDCDAVLFDEDSLNLLKSALNSGERRRICWNKESRILALEDIPDAFDFKAGIIFLTNINFENVRNGRIADHLKAIISRCHYMDLEMDGQRDKILRIKQCVDDGMLMELDLAEGEEEMIVNWIVDNKDYLRELSLRMVTKIAELVKAFPTDWEEYAESTCLTKEAKIARLMAAKQAQQTALADLASVQHAGDKQNAIAGTVEHVNGDNLSDVTVTDNA